MPIARDALAKRGDVDWEAGRLLARHNTGDWGNAEKEDQEQNKSNLESGKGELFSVYKDVDAELWVITEPHNKLTTILCPRDIESVRFARRGH